LRQWYAILGPIRVERQCLVKYAHGPALQNCFSIE
jgi:hypothetical protein